ncbi:CRISPR-associated helicase Cas3' [Candidatus Methylomicrobium oryzae]|uniref:CRISPR-associated helicase Cas3' n=1 Tax=Candidatus Methylomicrobium oryzae TaxID=2802053 RepID=UPI001922ED5E|nr:CRISPR-associated helicase Cas3' [Methylomicrobium sp. RS1]MBL1265256.1 CRISPR-associated helicase Cas3' [Methylomicrobium sp. RS1]
MFRKETTKASPPLPLTRCLAKTYVANTGEKKAGRQVLNHCHIVGEVARGLLARLPDWLVAELFPNGVELIAAAHDIGKVSPTFQAKIYKGTDAYKDNLPPELISFNPEIEHQWGGHAGVSQATAKYLKVGKFIPEILGQHHGYSPNVANLATDEVFGGSVWQQRREELLTDLKSALQTDFPTVQNELQARILAGFTSVSDWIGSGSLFNDPAENWQPKIEQAIDEAGFVRPILKPDLRFTDIFSWQPRDTQQYFIEQVKQPGVYVLEAPMGLGKTEAALYAAYQLLVTHQASGLYFALPTQLTSDKIHERVGQFLQRILVGEGPHQQPLLLHGNAWLKTELGKEGNPGGSWFQASKRGILAPFAVGTIDQALMAVMNVKHGFVRTFGLAGKVVILDEVHSYDSYTGTLLDELVKVLRELHCTVIILSATLTQQRRSALLGTASSNEAYPLISALPKNGCLIEQPVLKIADCTIAIQHCYDEDEAIEEALRRAELSQQVLWVENTVAEAQRIYQALSARDCEPKIECGLLHSRFLKMDREKNEEHWTRLYGKDGGPQRQQCGRILVGTQVLEQSLDIDADFLISRFAPSDMLLQRMGRLWRHSGTVRIAGALCETWLLVPELASAIDNPEQAFGQTAKIYSPYVLCRSLEVWQDRRTVAVPGQIREIIEATYMDRGEGGAMLSHLNALEKKKEEMRNQALFGLSKAGKTLPEEKASTRYSAQDSVEVLLIKNYRLDTQQGGCFVRFLDDTTALLPEKGKGLSPWQRRELAAKLLRNTVRVADYLAPKAMDLKSLDWLQDYIYLGKHEGESRFRLRVARVLDSDTVVSLDGGDASEEYTIQYDQQLGYLSIKK